MTFRELPNPYKDWVVIRTVNDNGEYTLCTIYNYLNCKLDTKPIHYYCSREERCYAVYDKKNGKIKYGMGMDYHSIIYCENNSDINIFDVDRKLIYKHNIDFLFIQYDGYIGYKNLDMNTTYVPWEKKREPLKINICLTNETVVSKVDRSAELDHNSNVWLYICTVPVNNKITIYRSRALKNKNFYGKHLKNLQKSEFPLLQITKKQTCDNELFNKCGSLMSRTDHTIPMSLEDKIMHFFSARDIAHPYHCKIKMPDNTTIEINIEESNKKRKYYEIEDEQQQEDKQIKN